LRCAMARRQRASARQAGESDANTDAPRRSHWLSPEAPAWPVACSHRLGCGIGVVASNLNQAFHPPEWFRGCAGC
jgi:hypothetical protein